MNKTQLIAKVAEATNTTKKEAAANVEATLNAIAEAVAKGESVQLVGFGTFSVKERAARTGKNPRTGEVIEIAATKVPHFKPGKEMKEAVNG